MNKQPQRQILETHGHIGIKRKRTHASRRMCSERMIEPEKRHSYKYKKILLLGNRHSLLPRTFQGWLEVIASPVLVTTEFIVKKIIFVELQLSRSLVVDPNVHNIAHSLYLPSLRLRSPH